jgi:hypothetical protein
LHELHGSVTAIKNGCGLSRGMWKVQTVLGYCTKNAAKEAPDFT